MEKTKFYVIDENQKIVSTVYARNSYRAALKCAALGYERFSLLDANRWRMRCYKGSRKPAKKPSPLMIAKNIAHRPWAVSLDAWNVSPKSRAAIILANPTFF